MLSPRWKKLWRDLGAARGRMAMMITAIAVSIFGVGTVLSAYTILTREISRNYLETHPASAFIELDRVDEALVEQVRQMPGIAEAEATSWVSARVEVRPEEWLPMQLFVIPNFNTLRLNTVRPTAGDWPPAEQTILLEREAAVLLKTSISKEIQIQTLNGPETTVRVSGLVHDPGLAPAWQEQTAYGYITPATLAWLGESETLHILKIRTNEQPQTVAAIETQVSSLAAWLKTQGYKVHEIRIPPPDLHPHQSQMNSVLMTLLTFSLMALVLSAILTATMIGGLLAQQVRQIGIMKAIGARSSQIGGLYLVLVVALGLLAVLLGLPLGNATGRGFVGVVAQLLNLEIYDTSLPIWVYLVELLMGTLVPLLVAFVPIWRTSQVTVRETLSDYGTSRNNPSDRWLGGLRGIENTLLLALRNAFRRPARLGLTLGLLAAAGSMFITGLNVRAGWDAYLKEAADGRHYDLEIRFNEPQPTEKINALISTTPGVSKVESWNTSPLAVYRPDGLDIVRTYPDGGHGSFSLRAMPPGSNLIESPMRQGRWLAATDIDGVLLNQNAAAFVPNARIGEPVTLMVEGQPVTLRLVGITQQVLSPATAYVLPEAFAKATGIAASQTNTVRIVLNQADAASSQAAITGIENSLSAQAIRTKVVISEAMLESATSGHVYVFIIALMVIALVMAVVGGLGLMSSMSTSVIERTREFGIMRAIGARSGIILRNVISEGVFIGLLSWAIALPLSLPLTWGIGALIGNMAFRSPLPLILSPVAVIAWLAVILIGSIAASTYPARQASRLTVRETLAYI